MHTSRIQLKYINFSDNTFAFIPEYCQQPPNDSLRQSIQERGLFHPPIVREESPTSFQIIAGRKRLMILHDALNAQYGDCIKLPADCSAIDALTLALEEKLLHQPLTAVERAFFFQKALQYLPEKEVARRFLARMGLSLSVYHISKSIKLLSLEEPLIIALHNGSLDEKVAYELCSFSFGDRMAFFEILQSMNLSVGNQKKLVVSCRELVLRGQTTILNIFNTTEVHEVINQAEANIPQQTAKLMNWLTHQRFPRLSQAEKEFRQFVSESDLPDGLRLDHAPSFETDDLRLTIPCKNKDDFLTILEKIKPLLISSKHKG